MSMMKGAAIGAGLMYFLDPQCGKRRQRDLTEQISSFAGKRQRALKVMQRDFSNRTKGFVCELQGRANDDEPTDSLLEQRVRSTIGRVVTTPSAIDVHSEDGIVTLSGEVMDSEVDELVSVTHMVSGVKHVQNELTTTESDPQPCETSVQLNPAESLVAVGAGTLLVVSGFLRGGSLGPIFKIGGILLAAKGFSDTERRFQRKGSRASGDVSMAENSQKRETSRASLH
jgi:hypothetical protein